MYICLYEGGINMLLKLKAKIIEKYRTQSRFAVCCGKKEQWLTRILTERQLPTPEEKQLFAMKLNIENIDDYFHKTTDSGDSLQ